MISSLILQMGGGFGGMWGVALVGPLFGLLVAGGLLYVLWNAITGGHDSDGHPSTDDPAMETLRERYARGEISDEEYEERARRLRNR